MAGWLNLDTGRLGNAGSSGGILGSAGIPDLNVTPEKSAFEFMGLTWQQRLTGFGACAGVGFLMSIIGSILLFLPGGIIPFAFLYAVGTVLSLVGTGFLVGFWKQCKMFKPVRLVASLIFLGSLVLVFIGAFVLRNAILCIVFVVICYLAFAWYSLSYVPYARTLVKNFVGRFTG